LLRGCLCWLDLIILPPSHPARVRSRTTPRLRARPMPLDGAPLVCRLTAALRLPYLPRREGKPIRVPSHPPTIPPRHPRIKSDYDDGNNVCVSKPEPNNFANITLGPITRRHLVSMLRTAEAALRRLIVLFVKVHGVKASAKTKRTRPLPDFASFGSVASNRPPVFNLFDPRKRLVFGFDEDTDSNPTNSSSSDLIGGSMHGPRIMFPHTHSVSLGVDPRVKTEDDDGVGSAEKLLKRLAALDHALKTLPQQAKRLVRTLEQRKNAPPGIKRIPPIRPGIPPGFRDRGKHEVDDVLRECHGLMRDIQMSPP